MDKAGRSMVMVTWRDAEDGPTWVSEAEAIKFAHQDCEVESIGWLIKKTKKFIVLGADLTISGNNPGELGRITKIPRSMIIKIDPLMKEMKEMKEVSSA